MSDFQQGSKEANPPKTRDTARTIAHLKKASMEILMSEGLTGLSTRAIADRAGTSRGAIFHHFATKNHLVAAAFDDLLVDFVRRLQVIGHALRHREIELDDFVMQVSQTVSDDLFAGCLEISLAIRSNEELGLMVQKAVANWRMELFQLWEDTFEHPSPIEEDRLVHWTMAANCLRGFAFTLAFKLNDSTRERHLVGFKRLFLEDMKIRYAEQEETGLSTHGAG